jgi:hypothetical protein
LITEEPTARSKANLMLKIAISLLVVSGLFAIIFGSEKHPTYYEANDLLNAIWKRQPLTDFGSPIEFSIDEIVGSEFVHVCHFSEGGNVVEYVKTQHSIEIKTFVRGALIDDWDTEHLYKILLVTSDGKAMIWNFDKRLYEVRRYDESRNCFEAKDVSIVVSTKPSSNGKRFTLINLAKKS